MEKQTGIELIAKEREEQINKHGRTVESDSHINKEKQLSWVASTLISPLKIGAREKFASMPIDWDEMTLLKMCLKGYKERLIIAGALIAAELDRLTAIEDTTT